MLWSGWSLSVFAALALSLSATLPTGAAAWPFKSQKQEDRPLHVSPLLREGKWQRAQKEARVSHPELAGSGVESYSGYLTVNETCDSNTFFWFFRASKQPKSAPLLVWLQGGPGTSSMLGLFSEVGPWTLDKNRAKKREYSWTDEHHMVFFDNPVGTGFSYTGSESCYARDEQQIGEDLYEAVTQLLRMFPDLADREVFLTGESYAGKYIPALARAVARHNPTAASKVNVKGLMMGNAFTDPISTLAMSDLLFQLGLLDFSGKAEAEKIEDHVAELIHQGAHENATDAFSSYLSGFVGNRTGFENFLNFLHSTEYIGSAYVPYVMRTDIRRALHVGDKEFNNRSAVVEHMKADFTQSYGHWIPDLLDSYRITYYTGQLDLLVAYPYVESFLRNLAWVGQKEYNKAVRRKWFVGGQLAGYVTNHGPLSHVLVRNAGHLVPADQPRWAYDLLRKFVKNELLGS